MRFADAETRWLQTYEIGLSLQTLLLTLIFQHATKGMPLVQETSMKPRTEFTMISQKDGLSQKNEGL